ncbi:MAG: PilZ domain-containing protein [Acidobacteriota bacterium]
MSAIGVRQKIERDVNSKNEIRANCFVDGLNRECRVHHLNENGLFVESFIPALTGAQVDIKFNLPNGYHISTQAIVTHHQFKEGYKINFINLSEKDGEQINNWARA